MILFSMLLIGLAMPQPAQAGCSEIDLRAKLGPPRDQGETGWCFANTSADLISAKLGSRVSAFDLAIQYVAHDPYLLRRVPGLISYLAAHPGTEQKIRQGRRVEPENFLPTKIMSLKGVFGSGGTEDHTVLLANIWGACEDPFDRGTDQSLAQLRELRQTHVKLEKQLGRGRTAEAVFSAAKQMLEKVCPRRIRPRQPFIPDSLSIADGLLDFLDRFENKEKQRAEAQKSLWNQIDESLDKQKIVAIGYDANELLPPGEDEGPGDSDHSSIVAARRLKNGHCEYFIRNSWGTGCDFYLPKARPNCEASTGGVWVKAATLKTLYSVVGLQ